jgi:hypothetical protein
VKSIHWRQWRGALALALTIVLALLPAAASSAAVAADDEHLDTLTVGSITYSNVIIKGKTRSDVFIRHATGMANLKVKDLDPAVRLQLGYQVSAVEPEEKPPLSLPSLGITNLNPQALEAQVTEQATQMINQLEPFTVIVILAGAFVAYLFACYCASLICHKATGNDPGLLVWLPVFQWIPLFRAAGMSGWWLLGMFVFPVSLIAYVLWSFKIAAAREKNAFVGFLLLLPVINVLAFLYLAFSTGREEAAAPSGKVLTYTKDHRRKAA